MDDNNNVEDLDGRRITRGLDGRFESVHLDFRDCLRDE